ncbi:MAG TPA: DUF4388 domain-containing protein [Polyangiaceae bacterium]
MSARVLVVDDSPTIRKVVASILAARSYEPLLAADGRDALAILQEQPVDLILLDFVMPRMNGYQFCRELRSKPNLRELPVVLMSAKGDKIRGQFVQQTGSVDAITKPFDARGLVAVIEAALQKKMAGRVRQVDAAAMPEEESAFESQPSGLRVSDEPGVRRAQNAHELGSAVARLLAPQLSALPGVSAPQETLRMLIQQTFTPAVLEQLSGATKVLLQSDGEQQALSGDLSVVSIAEVLQLFELQRQTGALSVSSRNSQVVLFLRNGHLDFASFRGLRDEFLIGRYFIQAGVLSRDELQQALSHRPGPPRLLGETLVVLGHASEQQVHDALVSQTSELVYELVRWPSGRFAFQPGVSNPAAVKAALGLPCGALVMEGFRRVDEWRLIEGSFDFDEVLYCDQVAIERMWDSSSLTNQEQRVLEVIDGERTVREIVDVMGGSAFELCKILYQFLNSRLVRRRAA